MSTKPTFKLADFEGQTVINVHPETSGLFGISKGSAYQAVHDGTIPSLRLGRRILVPLEPLRRLLEDGPA